MAEHIRMIALSPTMEEGTIAGWSKKEGDKVDSGDVLCEVETDKATMDYESTQEGTLLKILVDEGDSVQVGVPIGIIGEEGEDVSELVSRAAEMGKAESHSEGTTPPAPGAPAPAQPKGDAPAPEQSGLFENTEKTGEKVRSSPLARKIAEMKGIDIAAVRGSGPEGRVVKRDIEKALSEGQGVPLSAETKTGAVPAGGDRRIPLSQKRKIIAKRLSESKFQAPHYYLKITCEMETLLEARKRLNAGLPEKVSFNAFMIKLSAMALAANPGINASWQGDAVLQYGSIDIGLAVDLGNGLITPVVRNCRNKGILAIDNELKELIRKAGEGALLPEEYSGATFSISNLGSFGIEEFTAIINPPGSAILALGKVEKQPVAGPDDILQIRSRMTMTLSCDHRVIDGTLGAKFLSDLKGMMENPIRSLY
jgi:pyruvate dehydrogenase E2 component (dihydrolipoamide acetyltransferase)